MGDDFTGEFTSAEELSEFVSNEMNHKELDTILVRLVSEMIWDERKNVKGYLEDDVEHFYIYLGKKTLRISGEPRRRFRK
jgi:hypothetical protein